MNPPIQSAGILLYRITNSSPEFFLVHPGGPLYGSKDLATWSIPKGRVESGESIESAARREFHEETSFTVSVELKALTPVVSKSGKTVYAFAANQDVDSKLVKSNTKSFEWPPKSGNSVDFPEVDRGEWFSYETSLTKISPYMAPLLIELNSKIVAQIV